MQQTSPVIKVEIKCPNCDMRRQHEYTKENYSPMYAKCPFCETLYVWKKRGAVEIIPQTLKQYHINL